jgi:hypothetical protein|tara:strand:- start:4846 stop:5064 length:219 start_codon:yes stop_codon:yes gene_type:complete
MINVALSRQQVGYFGGLLNASLTEQQAQANLLARQQPPANAVPKARENLRKLTFRQELQCETNRWLKGVLDE